MICESQISLCVIPYSKWCSVPSYSLYCSNTKTHSVLLCKYNSVLWKQNPDNSCNKNTTM